MSPVDLSQEAIDFVKSHAKEIVEKLAGSSFPAAENPLSLFMAGSPGAGKTEFSKNLVSILESSVENSQKIVLINPDEIREMLPQYQPGNAHLFQSAVSIGVEKVHDFALAKSKSFILDGTLTNLEKARANIKRSLARSRAVIVHYLYQEPLVAWDFTQKREIVEGRNIPKDIFVEQFVAAPKVVKALKQEFSEKVSIVVVTRDLRDNNYRFLLDVTDIDAAVPRVYTKDELRKLLS